MAAKLNLQFVCISVFAECCELWFLISTVYTVEHLLRKRNCLIYFIEVLLLLT